MFLKFGNHVITTRNLIVRAAHWRASSHCLIVHEYLERAVLPATVGGFQRLGGQDHHDGAVFEVLLEPKRLSA